MRDDLHEFARWLRGQRAARRWSRRQVAHELRQRARAHGEQLPAAESVIKTIARWEHAEHRPDDFYAGLLLEVFDKAALASVAGPSILEPVERRAFLRGLGAFTGFGASFAILEPWERLSAALRRPGRVDAETVDGLEHVTVLLEQMESQASPASLLGPVVGHLENIGRLIAGSPPDTLDRRLCSLAGETAALAGWLSWDLRDGRVAAAAYFRAGLEAATEAGDRALGAYLVGSSCVEPAYRERPIARLRRLEGQTFGFTRSDASPATRAWLVTLEAEAHALAGDQTRTLRALDEAEAAMSRAGEQGNARPRVTFFDPLHLAGERGVALARLGQPEQAQEVLRPALVSMDTTAMKTRPRLLTALATAHVQQGDVDEASRLGIEALALAVQQQVQPNLQDVRKVRLDLEPWRGVQAVREFDEQLRAIKAA
jgi:hypothetical protein